LLNFVVDSKLRVQNLCFSSLITGDSIILNCQADGTPTPEILWYKDANPVEMSSTVGIFNDGTELRISTIRHEDIGDYTCIARNGEGQVSHTARVIIAGGAVIMVKNLIF
jgi:immunoglobulin superfamily member 9B